MAAGPRLDEAMSRTACVTVGKPGGSRNETANLSVLSRVGGGCGQAPVWIRGLPVHSWAQTFTGECRALCKLAVALLSTSKPGADSRDWSQMVEVHKRTTRKDEVGEANSSSRQERVCFVSFHGGEIIWTWRRTHAPWPRSFGQKGCGGEDGQKNNRWRGGSRSLECRHGTSPTERLNLRH